MQVLQTPVVRRVWPVDLTAGDTLGGEDEAEDMAARSEANDDSVLFSTVHDSFLFSTVQGDLPDRRHSLASPARPQTPHRPSPVAAIDRSLSVTASPTRAESEAVIYEAQVGPSLAAFRSLLIKVDADHWDSLCMCIEKLSVRCWRDADSASRGGCLATPSPSVRDHPDEKPHPCSRRR